MHTGKTQNESLPITNVAEQVLTTDAGFQSAAEMEAASFSRLAALKQLYLKQLGYDAAHNSLTAVA